MNEDKLFVLRYPLMTGNVYITVWEGSYNHHSGRTRLDVEVRQNRKVIFPRGVLYCSPSPCHSVDGTDARELVSSLVAMKPGDTDQEYFSEYSPEQLAWAEANGEDLTLLSQDRYCDPETGCVRERKRRS
jgi:hypothetical protein